MVASYFLDTCILYAYLNETDKFNNKTVSYIDKLIQTQDNLVITQYVLYEFMLLSLKRAAEDYFEENTNTEEIPGTKINQILQQIEEQKDILSIIGISVYETTLPAKYTLIIEDLIKKLTIKKVTKMVSTYVKIMGVMDYIHLICCKINKCQYFVTIDRDFANQSISKFFEKYFDIVVL